MVLTATGTIVQKELGDVVYVELPEVGASVVQGENFGVVESVKVSAGIYVVVVLEGYIRDFPKNLLHHFTFSHCHMCIAEHNRKYSIKNWYQGKMKFSFHNSASN